MDREVLAITQNERMANGNVDRAHVADVIGNGVKTTAHLLKEWPVTCFVHILELFHLQEEFIEVVKAHSLRATVEGKRVLLELADQIDKTKPDGVGLYLARRVAGPVASFFGQYQVSCHKSVRPFLCRRLGEQVVVKRQQFVSGFRPAVRVTVLEVLKRGANLFALAAEAFDQVIEPFALLGVSGEQVNYVHELRTKGYRSEEH